MKKHLIFIVNIILIIAILCGVFYAMYNASKMNYTPKPQVKETAPATAATFDEPTVPAEIYDIGIIQHSDISNCNDVYQGFIAGLAEKGYINNSNINLHYALEEDNEKCKEAIQGFIDADYDLIFAIGPFASKLAASMTTDIPIVFGAVAEPEKEGLVESNETPKGNVTGISDYTPCFEQIDSVKVLFPNCQKIGAIYSASDEEAVTQALVGEKEAKTKEVNIPYVKYPVTSVDEIKDSLDKMVKDGVDVIYAPIDSFIDKNLDTVVEFSIENKIPIICGNMQMLEKGCFSTSVISYQSIGSAAADMALNILCNNVNPGNLPVAYVYDCYLHINQESLVKLGINISDDVKATAIIE